LVTANAGGAQAALGVGIAEKGLLQRIEFGFSWVLIGCLLLGVAILVLKRKEMVAGYAGSTTPPFLRTRFEIEYFVLALSATGLLAACVVVPELAQAYSLDRTFFFVMTILSVFFVIGTIILSAWGIAILEAVHRKLKETSAIGYDGRHSQAVTRKVYPNAAIAVALIIILPYFLISSGAVYAMTETPKGWVFESRGLGYFELIVHDQESAGAKWVGTLGQTQSGVAATDPFAANRLFSQGHIPSNVVNSLTFQKNESFSRYTYLDYYNTVEQKYVIWPPQLANPSGDMADHITVLSSQSRVYDAGGAQVYFDPAAY
jgi:uncharacterized membrane protein